ncbi:MAG: nucleoside 2-deoxyribosyltransferase [Thermoguttaceae bacterium]
MNVYFAGPLFTMAERRFNQELSVEMQRLCPGLDIFFPQACDKEFQGLPDFAERVYQALTGALDRCDAVVAILDGADSDSGTCIEIGYARAKGKPVIGVRTDFRDGEVHGLNIMTAGICSSLIKLSSTSSSISEVAESVVRELNGGLNQSGPREPTLD